MTNSIIIGKKTELINSFKCFKKRALRAPAGDIQAAPEAEM